MSSPPAPRLPAAAPGAAPAPQQAQFDTLVQQVAAGRAAVAEWNDRIARCDQALLPLHRQLHLALREWAKALDEASWQPTWSRTERRQLSELVRGTVEDLAGAEGLDAELAALLERHGAAPPLPGPALASPEPEPPPAEPGVPEAAIDPDAWEREAHAAAAQREHHAASRRAARQRRRMAQQGEDASQSLREVYRKLASALHPDREPDPQQRQAKTALMQQANQAYAQGNLLALLEMQWSAEQAAITSQAMPDARRVGHYISVLQGQLDELQREARQLEARFRSTVGAPPGVGLSARKADRLVSAEAQRLRADLDAVAQQMRWLRDPQATQAWLRALRASG